MTYHPKSDFIAVMMQRGFLADCTDYQGLDDALVKGGLDRRAVTVDEMLEIEKKIKEA